MALALAMERGEVNNYNYTTSQMALF